MDKTQLFRLLQAQEVPALIKVLSRAYDELNTEQREIVFASFADDHFPDAQDAEPEGYEVDGAMLAECVAEFKDESLSGLPVLIILSFIVIALSERVAVARAARSRRSFEAALGVQLT